MHHGIVHLKGRRAHEKEKLRTGLGEWLLFHGMNPSHALAICKQNFNWRICGTHGTMYGKGSYVARDASCSHQYCPSSTGYHSMFVTLAVVGDFVHGIKAYLCPPSRPEISNRLSDSCVDDQKILQFLSSLRRTRFILPISWSILVGCCQR